MTRRLEASILLALVLLVLPLAAQDKPPQDKPAPPLKSTGAFKPSRISQAPWPVDGFNRVLHVHTADQTDAGAKGLYFYRPPLALDEAASPPAGFPAIVHKAKVLPSGATQLWFAARLAVKEFHPIARALVWEQDREALKLSGVRLDQVDVRPWPITHAVVDCKIDGEKEPLASGETDVLGTTGEVMPFTLTFTPEAVGRFRRAFADGELRFSFAYTFEGQRVAEGSATATASKVFRTAAEDSLRQHLTPGQRAGTTPIFRAQMTAIDRDLKARVTRVIRAQNPALFPLLSEGSGSLVGKLFEFNKEFTADELQGDKAVAEAVAGYLKPLVETWAEADKKDDKLTREGETKHSVIRVEELGFGFKLGFGKEGKASGSFDANTKNTNTTTDDRRDLLRSEYGVETKLDKGGQFYVPYSIKTFKTTTGGGKTELEDSTVAFLAVGEANQYLQETAVPADFTAVKLKALLAKDARKPKPERDDLDTLIADAVKAADAAKDRHTKATAAHAKTNAEAVAAQNDLAAAKQAVTAAATQEQTARTHAELAAFALKGVPAMIPVSNEPVRGRLGGGVPNIPMKPNPDHTVAQKKSEEAAKALEAAIAQQAAAKARVGTATTAEAAAVVAADASKAADDAAHRQLILAETRLIVLKDLLKERSPK